MKLPFTPISHLQPTSENEIWKIKARVSRAWRFQNNDRPGDTGGLDLILVDEQGDRIQACLRGKLISKFEEVLAEGECCVLMNFKLSPNLGSYRGTKHPFKIFFTWSSHVKPSDEIPNHRLRFNFIPFDELLSQTFDETVFIDVIGEIVGMNDLKQITTARNVPCKLLNLQLRNLDGSIIDCVFWEKYAEDIHSYVQSFDGGPIVMLCSLMRSNIYNGKFTIQSAKSPTKLFINSDIYEINEFKEKMPKDVLSTISSDSTLTLSNSSQVSSYHVSVDSLKTISELLGSHEEMTCSVIAKICALKTEIPWFYIGCPKCFKKVNHYFNPETEEIEEDKLICDICQKIVTSTLTRYKVYVDAMDDTGTTTFLMFDREVIQLIHKSAYELLEQQVQFNRGNQYPQELLALEGRQIVFTVTKPATAKTYVPTNFKVLKITDAPEKMLMLYDDDVNTADTTAIGPHISNSTKTTKTTMNLIGDVSLDNSTSASTDSTDTPTKKRPVISEESSEDCVVQLSTKKVKPEVTSVPEEEFGELSSTKSKPNVKNAAKDVGAKYSSRK